MTKPSADIRSMIDVRKWDVGPAHSGSPLLNPITPLSVLNNAIDNGLTGGVKGALVVNGSFDITYVNPDLSLGIFSGFTKDVANSFLDTSYFLLDSVNNRIEILKICYFLIYGDGHITLTGGTVAKPFVHSFGMSSSGGPTITSSKIGYSGLNNNIVGPLMISGAIGDFINVLASSETPTDFSSTAAVGSGGVCRLQFLVVG